MSKSHFKYQTIKISNRLPLSAKPSGTAKAVGSIAELGQKGMLKLNNASVSYRINSEIENMADEIEKWISNYEKHIKQCRGDIGVLIVANILETSSAVGSHTKSFHSVHIGGIGTDFRAVVQKYLSEEKIVKGKPWFAGKETKLISEFIWLTRA